MIFKRCVPTDNRDELVLVNKRKMYLQKRSNKNSLKSINKVDHIMICGSGTEVPIFL